MIALPARQTETCHAALPKSRRDFLTWGYAVNTTSLRVICRLIALFCAAVLCGCAGRAQSTLSYIPPEKKAEIRQQVVLSCDMQQARLAAARYFQTAFSARPEPGATHSALTFRFRLPEEELQNALDCGLLSALSPSVSENSKWSVYEKRITPSATDTPKLFAAAAPKTEFLLADGTSTPRPARMTAAANVTTTITLTSPAPGKTLLVLHTAWVVDLELRRWVMVSGFSPMAAQRSSARFMDEARIAFDSGNVGALSTQFPERNCNGCFSGAWRVKCVSTGAFENKVINGIVATLPHRGNP